MTAFIRIVYVGNKPSAFDNVAKSGACWRGKGDIQEVTDTQAKQLLKYPDQWALVAEADAEAINKPSTTEVTNEDGEQMQVDAAALAKPLEHMSKAELVALAKAKWGMELDANRGKKFLIDAIEEFDRDLEPVANIG